MEMNKPLYDEIGTGYNTTRQADRYITDRLYSLLQPGAGGLILDIGCGTGNYTVALSNHGLKMYGIEPAKTMLDIARQKSSDVNWLNGKAEEIPFENEKLDGAIATLTIHHWQDLKAAFQEIYRVIKPGAKFILFTATPRQMEKYWLNYYFPQMMRSSIEQMPALQAIENAAYEAGLELEKTEKYLIQDDLDDAFLYSGKHKPQIYFDAEIRNGISSFTALANILEVSKGLLKLKSNMEHNRFAAIKQSFENDLGDYLFIVFKK